MKMQIITGLFVPGLSGFWRGILQLFHNNLNFKFLSVSTTSIILIFTLQAFSQAPDFKWAKGLGGTGNDFGNSMAIDALGNVYATGAFSGTIDFDPGPAVFNLTSVGGGTDMFVSKLNNVGNFLWAVAFHRTIVLGGDWSEAITVDAAGDVYITGEIAGTTDFDPSPSVLNLTATGSNDVFVAKLNSSGNLIWAKIMYGFWSSLSNDIVIEPATGAVYTTGGFEITVDFDPGSGTFWLSVAGGEDAFISKLDASGNFIWAKRFGGTWHEEVASLTLDASGNVYTTGEFQNTADFDPGTGIFNLTAVAEYDVFISKLNSSGNFVWAKRIGGPGLGIGSSSIVLDISGNLYISGSFNGTVDFDPGSGVFNITSSGWDSFICKLDNSGNFIWVKRFGGSGNEGCSSMKLDVAGNIYSTGGFSGTADFDPGAGVFNVTSAGIVDVFISKLDNSGNFMWVKSGGGTNVDGSRYLIIDALSRVHVIGNFSSPFLPLNPITLTNQGPGVQDIFIAQLDSGMPGPLPVELAYFSATATSDYQVEVKWTTFSEINNDYFVLQKSMDGHHFEDCANIKGAGNSSTDLHYHFLDENPFQTPISYYRLKQVDYDGTSVYSECITVAMDKSDFELISLFGNAVSQTINIYFTTSITEMLDYRLYDALGKIQLQKTISPEKGINHLSIDASKFVNGIYYFSISNSKDILKSKVYY